MVGNLGSWRPAKRVAIALLVLGFSMMGGATVSAMQEPAPQAQAPTPPAPAQDHPEFPAGPGRDTTLRVCSVCHSANNILAMGRDQQGWEDIITQMSQFGAQASDAEFSEILAYLTKNFPPKPAPAAH